MSEWVEEMAPDRARMMLRGALSELATVENVLAETLGYQRGDGGPDDPTGGGWIIGEHTAVSLAMEARARFKPQEAEADTEGDAVTYPNGGDQR